LGEGDWERLRRRREIIQGAGRKERRDVGGREERDGWRDGREEGRKRKGKEMRIKERRKIMFKKEIDRNRKWKNREEGQNKYKKQQ
jgi:hypothetical protein